MICVPLLLLQMFPGCVCIPSAESGCAKTPGRVDCSGRNLGSIPDDITNERNVLHLDFSHNDIGTIDSETFSTFTSLLDLDLSHNKISGLHLLSFQGLQNLKVLNISHNQLKMPSSFMPGVFQPLHSLEILVMHGTKREGGYPDDALKDLTNLKELYIKGTHQILGPGFLSLTKLQVLYLSPPDCNIGGPVRNQMFENLRLSPLKELVMRNCRGGRMESNALTHLPRLTTLNVACNYVMGMRAVLEAVSRIPGSGLETLVIDDIDRSMNHYRFFNKTTVCVAKFPHLKRLSIRNNGIDSISMDVLDCMPSIEVWNVGFNALSLTWGPWHVFTSRTKNHWENAKIKQLDMSYAYSGIQTTFKPMYCSNNLQHTEEYFRTDPTENYGEVASVPPPSDLEPNLFDRVLRQYFQVTINPELEAVYLDNVQITFTQDQVNYAFLNGYISSPECRLTLPENNIRYISASHNSFKDFNCLVAGLNKLQAMDLSYCNLRNINIKMLEAVPNLKTLIVTGNELGLNYEQFEAATSFLPRVEFLSLSDNKIKRLPRNSFLAGNSLSDVDFSWNSLTTIDIALQNLSHLQSLDLSNNQIHSLPLSFIEELRNRPNAEVTLTINLQGNPFLCNCDATDFLKFLHTFEQYNIHFVGFDQYACHYKGSMVHLLAVDIAQLEDDCNEIEELLIIIVTLGVTIVLLIIAALMIYRCRWKLAWKVYEVRRLVRQAGRQRSFRIPVHQ